MKTKWTNDFGSPCLSSLEIDRPERFSAEQLQGVLQELNDANARHATPTQIAKGLAVLTAVCAKPSDFDDAKVVLWSERLKIVLKEYPDDIAMAMISDWPKSASGKWWPTENEVRGACDALMHFRRALAAELERAIFVAGAPALTGPPPSDGFDAEPAGDTAAYVRIIYARHPEKAAAYLTGARYRGDRIGTRFPMAEMALDRVAPGLAAEHGVRFVTPRAFRLDGLVEWGE